jgi:hypothetical protein
MSNNSTLQLAEVASKPMHLSEDGRYAYWYLRNNWLKSNDSPVTLDSAPNYYVLNYDDKAVLKRAYERVYRRYRDERAERQRRHLRGVASVIVGCLRHRKLYRRTFRKDGGTLQDLIERIRCHFGNDWFGSANQRDVIKGVGQFLKSIEKSKIKQMLPEPLTPEYWDRLPLYECSGELEATGLHGYKTTPTGRSVSTNRIRSYQKPYWDVGRDGGGQHEIRFRITQKLPDVACNLVSNLGSIERNGGHIHINCKRDHEVGQSVYHALCRHLSWFRYLAPLTRRRSRWCAVNACCENWDDALGRKYSAVSAAQFERLGTIEVRLWPTSRKPSEWRLRASLMQAIARWSEDHASADSPINNETAPQAWEQFYRWAAIHEPETLKDIIKAMKAKVRTINNTSRSVDRYGAVKCDEFVRQFDASDTRLRGYRRVERQPVTAVCSTDDQ